MSRYREMIDKALAKCRLKPCAGCQCWPCACAEIERRIAEQLRLKLDTKPQQRREPARTRSQLP